MSEKTIIEINGVKLEVDLRYAKRIEEFKIGDNVKVLVKQYSDFKSFPGVIVGFDNFKNLPTIIICYADISYSSAEVKFCYFNSETKDTEIALMGDHEKELDRQRAHDVLNKLINQKQNEVDELTRKRDYFIENYEKHFIGYTAKAFAKPILKELGYKIIAECGCVDNDTPCAVCTSLRSELETI